jgi:hypothetical protein
MKGTLVLAILRVQSSYLQEIEQPFDGKTGVPDTIQWWIGPQHSWRIKTFGLDHDIHVEEMVRVGSNLVKNAQEHNLSHYGEVMNRQVTIEFDDCTKDQEARQRLTAFKLAPNLEITPDGYAYWKPDAAVYSCQAKSF